MSVAGNLKAARKLIIYIGSLFAEKFTVEVEP